MSGNIDDTSPSKLGGGVPGFIPTGGFANMVVGGDISVSRRVLRSSFKSNDVKHNGSVIAKATCGPFRASNFGGDVLSRHNQSCGATNQVTGTRGQLRGLKLGDSVSSSDCQKLTNGVTPNQVKLASSNVKKVYDSSDYIRFKKLQAYNKTYNDKSFGGSNNGSYSFLNNLRG